ncbi:MAG TPA: hypothetical protein VIN08_16535 [Ohtaekwangia sp.]|uniref:hypothetical protein n=1 Tax=Ohtaekwangia sp. TaxID=2066019 RepID=UPI002F938041
MITRIYTTKQAVLDYDSSVHCVVFTCMDFMLPEEFKTILNVGLDFIRGKINETGVMFWISDATLSPVFNEEDTKWGIEDWTPRALAAGLRHVAFILPVEELAVIGIDEYKEHGSHGMTVAYFKDVASAKKWFKELTAQA